MSGLRTGCLSLTLLSGVAYLGLLSVPGGRHQESVNEALTLSRHRYQARKPQILDASTNGFLSPRLEPLWGHAEQLSKEPVYQALQAWTSAYSSQVTGHAIDHVGLLERSEPNYLASRREFAQWVPEMLTAFDKPVFQPLNSDFVGPSVAAKTVNYRELRSLAMGLNAYAESLLADKKVAEALLVYQGTFRLGWLVSDDTSIVATAVGTSIQALAMESLLSHWPSNAALDSELWREFSATIAQTTPTPVTLRRALENDLAMGSDFLRQPRMALDGDGKALRGLFLLPGMRAREQRIYQNLMGDVLAEADEGGIQSVPVSNTWANFLTGATGVGVALLVPDYRQQSARLTVHSAKMCGLAAFTAVCAYQAQNGRLPQSLAELDLLGLKAPGGVAWSAVQDVTLLRPDTAVSLVLASVSSEMFSAAGLNVEVADQIESARSTILRVRPDGFVFAVPTRVSKTPAAHK